MCGLMTYTRRVLNVSGLMTTRKKNTECAWTDDDTQEKYSVANNMVEIPPP